MVHNVVNSRLSHRLNALLKMHASAAMRLGCSFRIRLSDCRPWVYTTEHGGQLSGARSVKKKSTKPEYTIREETLEMEPKDTTAQQG